MTQTANSRVATSLAAWARAIDRAIEAQTPEVAARLSETVLSRLPRHLPTYVRLLEICWQTQRWSEGEEWARRLLQADPGNSMAWRALAQAAEVRDRRRQANIIWRRAFEMTPYDAEIRAGLNRTSLDPPHALAYDLACLAALYLCGRRWAHAAKSYRTLVQADRRRVDFQVCLTVALWQDGERSEAYALARHLVGHHPHLLMAWLTLGQTGDENDRALAANPIESMDPDGEYAATVWGVGKQDPDKTILVAAEEVELLEYR
jgi:tetratricopeptide (TPR) repeat protein